MLNQTNHKAQILLGIRNVAGYSESCFALCLNGAGFDISSSSTGNNYLEHCRNVAEDYAKRIRQNPTNEYVLSNGLMVISLKGEPIKCQEMTQEGVAVFKKTLESILKS